MIVDRGSNAGWGVEGITSLLVIGPYKWEGIDVRGYGVQTNRFTFGAYRGPGAPTAAFAVESLIDELAAQLDLDPLELRRRNALVEGDEGITGPVPTFGAVEVIEASAAHALWAKRDSLPEDEGIGVAVGYWPGGNEPAAAVCRVNTDGSMTVVTSAVDMTGVNTGFATIAAAAFGLPPEKVHVVMADTSSGPYAGASGGSKVTYTVGKAVERAAEATREKLLAAASEELEIAPGDLEVVDGVVRASARQTARSPSRRSRRRRCASAAVTSRSRATAARLRRASRRPWPRTSLTSRSIARRARWSYSATRSCKTSAGR